MKKRLILFTRYPEPGRTKTRLIPALGAAGAADLQRRMSEEMATRMSRFARAEQITPEIRYEGGSPQAMAEWLGREICCLPQGEGDLGERLAGAFARAFAQGCQAVVIIGADCPGLDQEILQQAFAALAHRELVLGPAADGGYYLVGLTRPAQSLFTWIPWGGDEVLAATLQKARNLGLTHLLLNTLNDIDRPADLCHLEELALKDDQSGACDISVIIPALNEEEGIARTLAGLAGQPGLEVIVADGGSRDRTRSVAEAAGARVLSSPPGRGTQQNAGARAARGKVLLFLHADTGLPAGFAGQILEAVERPGVVAGAFRFALKAEGQRFRVLECMVNWRAGRRQLPYGDQALFLTAAQFQAMDGFREIPLLEDLELVLRLRRLGKIIMLPSPATTSARRWRRLGFIRTTLVNQAILLGFFCGLSPDRLARWYDLFRRNNGGRPGEQMPAQVVVGDKGEKKA